MSIVQDEESDVTVSWDPLNNWVCAEWRNIPSRETVVKGCTEILDLMISKRASAVFNDNRKITGTWVRASNWVADDWFPRMIACGLKKFAWIESPVSTLSVISAKKSARRNGTEIIRLFKDAPEAERWLGAEVRMPAPGRTAPATREPCLVPKLRLGT